MMLEHAVIIAQAGLIIFLLWGWNRTLDTNLEILTSWEVTLRALDQALALLKESRQ